MDKSEKNICCICGREIEGYGYNPYPVKEEGQCCRRCNYEEIGRASCRERVCQYV